VGGVSFQQRESGEEGAQQVEADMQASADQDDLPLTGGRRFSSLPAR